MKQKTNTSRIHSISAESAMETNIKTIYIKGSHVSKSKKDTSFLRSLLRNRQRWTKCLYNGVSSIPPLMNHADNRMQIGRLLNAAICNEFPTIESVYDKPYDVIYKNHRSGDSRISVKTTKQRVFQVAKSNGQLSRPANIIVKNFYSEATGFNGEEWDYMLFVQQQSLKKDIPFGFGVISFKSLQKLKAKSHKNTVLSYQIENKDWDYFYISPTLLKPKDNLRLDYLYKNHMGMLYGSLLNDLWMEIPSDHLNEHIDQVRSKSKRQILTSVN